MSVTDPHRCQYPDHRSHRHQHPGAARNQRSKPAAAASTHPVICEARAGVRRLLLPGTHQRRRHPQTGHTRARTNAGVAALFTSDVVFATCGAQRDLRSLVADDDRREVPRLNETRARGAETRKIRKHVAACGAAGPAKRGQRGRSEPACAATAAGAACVLEFRALRGHSGPVPRCPSSEQSRSGESWGPGYRSCSNSAAVALRCC